MGLVCTCLRSSCPPSVPRALCALVSSHQPTLCFAGLVFTCLNPWALPLCRGTCVHLSWSPDPSSMFQGLYALVSPHQCVVCIKGLVCTCLLSPARPLFHLSWLPRPALCVPWFVSTAEVCMPFLSWHPRPALCTKMVVCSSVCMPHLFHHPGLALCATGLLWASLHFPCLPSDRGHSLWAIYRLKSAAFSIFCPLSPCSAWFSEIPQFLLGPACEGASQCTGTLPVSGLLPSLRAQAPIQKFSLFSLFMSSFSILPNSWEISLYHWRPGVFCCRRGCFVGVFLYLDAFFDVFVGRLVISPSSLPSSSAPLKRLSYLFH